MASIVDYRLVLGKNVHVLLADSNTNSLCHLKQQMELHSYEVTTVSSGLAALEVLAHNKQKVDLLLTDIYLPDRSGLSLLQDAVKLGLPTILMTHRADFVSQKRALENGACFCIGKPLEEKQVESLWQYVFLKEGLSKEQHAINIGCGKRQISENGGVCDHPGELSKSGKRARIWTEELNGNFMAPIGKFGPEASNSHAGVNYQHSTAPALGLGHAQVARFHQNCQNGAWFSVGKPQVPPPTVNVDGRNKTTSMPHLVSPTSVPLRSDNLGRRGRDNHTNVGQGNGNVTQGYGEGTSNARPSGLSLTPVPLPCAPGFSNSRANDQKPTVFGIEFSKIASHIENFKISSAEAGRNSTLMPGSSTSASDRQLSDNQETRLRNNNRSSGTVFSSSVLHAGREDLIQTMPGSEIYNGLIGDVVQGNKNVTQSTSSATPSSLNHPSVPLLTAPRTAMPGSEIYNGLIGDVVEGNRNVTQGTSSATPSSLNHPPVPLLTAPLTAMAEVTNDQKPSSSNHVPVENSFADFGIDEELQILLDTSIQVDLEEIFSNQQHFANHN